MLKSTWREPEIWAIAIAETIVWAGMYYLFAALINQWENDLGWTKTELAVGLTTCLIVSAIVSPFIGGLIDKNHGRKILISGALFGAILLALMANMTEQWQFIVIWALLGVASSCCFYEPCFAYIMHTRRSEAKGAITLVTLVAGFAGTLAFPIANLLAEMFHWRVAVYFFSAAIMFIAAPLFAFATRTKSVAPMAAQSQHDPLQQISNNPKKADTKENNNERDLEHGTLNQNNSALKRAMSGWTFWLVALAFGLMMLNHSSLLTHFLPLMAERSVSLEMAVLAASMIGPMQVLGRVIVVIIEQKTSILVIGALSFASLIVSAVFLIFAGEHPYLIFGFVIFQGMGIGVSSIMRPLIIAQLLGYEGFGAISGMATSIAQMLTAAAPTLAAAIWLIGGYDTVLFIMLIVAALATFIYILALCSYKATTMTI